MAYKTVDARTQIVNALGISYTFSSNNDRFIETNINGEDVVICCMPIVVRSSTASYDSQRYIDFSSMGQKPWTSMKNLWDDAIQTGKKFFVLCENNNDSLLKDYILSVERSIASATKSSLYLTSEMTTALTSGVSKIKRLKLEGMDGYFSIIAKNELCTYVDFFDNRPYIREVVTAATKSKIVEVPKMVKEVEILKNNKLKFSRNRLLTGAPGTGKSHRFSEDSEEYKKIDDKTRLYSDEEIEGIVKGIDPSNQGSIKEELSKKTIFTDIKRVTFYSDYSYGDFVGCYKPMQLGGTISYEFVTEPMLDLLLEAITHPYDNYLLIIEEINRAKAASVFGDIFQLLDRNSDGVSEYSIDTPKEMHEKLNKLLESDNKYYGSEWEEYRRAFIDHIFIPGNLYIWATMNMADQGVYSMDSAFKRRWDFEFMPIDGEDTSKEYLTYVIKIKTEEIESEPHYILWNNFRNVINNKLKNAYVEEDRLIGPYFIKGKKSIELKKKSDGAVDKYVEIPIESLINKLFTYLKQDVLRFIGAEELFLDNNNTRTMSSIRNAILIENKGISEILRLNNEDLDILKSVVFEDIIDDTAESEDDSPEDNSSEQE